MGTVKKPNLPIDKIRVETDSNGDMYTIEVSIEQTNDCDKYTPDGIKSIFRILKTNFENGERELVVLIDNHKPIGYHEHDELPENHDSRREIHADNWQEAWDIFDTKIKETIK